MFSIAVPERDYDGEGYIRRAGPAFALRALARWEGTGTSRLHGAMDLLAPVEASAESTLSCSSVDGRVRRYDLRMGQLFSDYVGSECGWAV